MNKYQKIIKKFTEDRNWGQFHNPKDVLLGIVEEIGELRNIVKWEQDLNKLREVLVKNRDQVEDEIGDIYWFLALLANGCGADINRAIERTINDNEKRFPVKEIKNKHTNRFLGGRDKKYDK